MATTSTGPRTVSVMSMPPGGDMDPPSKDDLRRLEARIDARLQHVSVRMGVYDRQYSVLGERIDQLDLRCDLLSARIDSRLHRIDQRFDSVESRLETSDGHMQEMLHEVKAGRKYHSRMTMLGVAGSTFTTAALCFGTLVVHI
jgi:hypothetical protein